MCAEIFLLFTAKFLYLQRLSEGHGDFCRSKERLVIIKQIGGAGDGHGDDGAAGLCKARPGPDCGSDHELHIAKFRLKLKKVGKTT